VIARKYNPLLNGNRSKISLKSLADQNALPPRCVDASRIKKFPWSSPGGLTCARHRRELPLVRQIRLQ
jgi:hypothetical protein